MEAGQTRSYYRDHKLPACSNELKEDEIGPLGAAGLKSTLSVCRVQPLLDAILARSWKRLSARRERGPQDPSAASSRYPRSLSRR